MRVCCEISDMARYIIIIYLILLNLPYHDQLSDYSWEKKYTFGFNRLYGSGSTWFYAPWTYIKTEWSTYLWIRITSRSTRQRDVMSGHAHHALNHAPYPRWFWKGEKGQCNYTRDSSSIRKSNIIPFQFPFLFSFNLVLSSFQFYFIIVSLFLLYVKSSKRDRQTL